MNSMDSGSLAFDSDSEEKENMTPHAHSGETTPGGDKETQWEVVSETMGIAPAEIIAQRLQAEGIPARARQGRRRRGARPGGPPPEARQRLRGGGPALEAHALGSGSG